LEKIEITSSSRLEDNCRDVSGINVLAKHSIFLSIDLEDESPRTLLLSDDYAEFNSKNVILI